MFQIISIIRLIYFDTLSNQLTVFILFYKQPTL